MCMYSKCKDEKEEAERMKRANGVQSVEGKGGPLKASKVAAEFLYLPRRTKSYSNHMAQGHA